MSKQYMVLKMVTNGLKGALNIVPMLGLVSQQIAEEAVKRLTQEDPKGICMIQEVGTA
jgi:hypothetical protein